MRYILIAILITAFVAIIPLQQAAAHGGGLDRHGCHRETATGTRHCHRENDGNDNLETAGAIILGVVVVIGVVYWLRRQSHPCFVSGEQCAIDEGLHFEIQYSDALENAEPADYLGLSYTLRF